MIPEETVKFAEEREREDNNLRQLLGSNNLKQAVNRMGGSKIPFKHFDFEDKLPENEKIVDQEVSDDVCTQPAKSLFPNFLCSAMLCAAPSAMPPEPKATELPMDMIHTTNEVIEFGAASLISSVSESTDGSSDDEYSDDEMEEHMNNFRNATAAVS